MKTEFTKEEMYEAYAGEVLMYLQEEHQLTLDRAEQLLIDTEFKQKFIQNISHFEFLEPSRKARLLYEMHYEVLKEKKDNQY